MDRVWSWLRANFDWFYVPKPTWSDVLDIIIIAYVLYHILLWFKTSRAWTLLKGILVVLIFVVLAALFHMNTVLWLAKKLVNVIVLAFIILFQPELRHALDELGRKKILKNIINIESDRKLGARLSEKSVYELVKTATQLSMAKTGALIVIEQMTPLGEIENTGIQVDATISHQLLVNVFEKNTPLHDGAILIRKNRVVAATCYLPLTERSDITKDLGTRHRAGLGISEVSDSMTIIVSEETGGVTVAYMGTLYRDLDEDGLRKQLQKISGPEEEPKKIGKSKKSRKGGRKHENV